MKSDAYYVIGGMFESAQWRRIVPGTAEVHGPLPYGQAMETWRERTFQTIDNAHSRYLIVEADRREECCRDLGITEA